MADEYVDKQATINGVPLIDANGDPIMESAFENDPSEAMAELAAKDAAKESTYDYMKRLGVSEEVLNKLDIDDDR